MVDAAINAGTPSAASPAADEADAAMLSRMAALAEALAAGFQAQGLAALKAGDLDRAGKAEAGFNSLFLGIRRAIALKARLRQQREAAQRKAEAHRDRRQDEKDHRRQAVAERVCRAIAAGKPEARERLTTGLWEKLTENERIDADLADTALPIQTLILRLGRDIGLSRRALAAGLAAAKADPAAAGPKAWDGGLAPPGYNAGDWISDEAITESASYCCIAAADLGLPGDASYLARVDTGEVFDDDDNVIMKLPVPDEPWRAGASDALVRSARAMAAERAVPPDPRPPPDDPDEAEFQRQAAYAKRHGITLLRPPALARRLGLPEQEPADGGSGNRSAADKRS
ncbi:hypothetical protein ACFW16_13055 [Inquilinus sp. NPDC058860]|uniref:hypothetical protein n=1 Tax=Inquilinus sp. NPDC058860 TaxID=3346652 RepID=UPI003674111A